MQKYNVRRKRRIAAMARQVNPIAPPDSNFLPTKTKIDKAGPFDPKWGVQWTIIVGIVSLIGGIIIAAIFFLLAEHKKEISYSISELTKAYDSTAESPAFTVLDSDGQRISGDIYITQLTLWNSGNEAIEPIDVQDRIKLVMYPVQRILEVKPLVELDSDIDVFTYTYDNLQLEPKLEKNLPKILGVNVEKPEYAKSIYVDWKHLNKQHGFRWQITYVGVPEMRGILKSSLAGFIVDIDSFQNVEINPAFNTFSDIVSNAFVLMIFLGPVLFLTARIAGLGVEIADRRRTKQTISLSDFANRFLVMLISSLIFSMFSWFLSWLFSLTIHRTGPQF